MECIKNSQNIEMINICKGEENTELNVVKQEKKEAEKTFLKKKKNALGQPVE